MVWLFLLACAPTVPEAAPVEVVVVRGDTLSKIAAAHGVSVDELRAVNGIEGDIIEVGQVLRIPDGRVARPARSPRPRKAAASKATGHGLTRPKPKPCLDPPDGTDLADDGMVGSRGLTSAEVQAVMGPHLQHTLQCPAQEASWPTGSVTAELTVACDGTVARVDVVGSQGLEAATVDCVRDVLGYAAFPAHDLPDGYTFTQPVRFSP